MVTFSVLNSIAARPCSCGPKPLDLMPPNGTCTSAPAVCEFTCRRPACASFWKRVAAARLEVKIAAERPNSVAFARCIASSSVEKR
jgi:hypothetical protein